MRTSTLFGAKKNAFFEIYSVPARTRGRESILCGRLLWTAPKWKFVLFTASISQSQPGLEIDSEKVETNRYSIKIENKATITFDSSSHRVGNR